MEQEQEQKEPQHFVEQQTVESLEKMLDEAAEEVRSRKSFRQELTREDINRVAETLEMFPVSTVLEFLAEKTGHSVSELTSKNDTRQIHCVSQADLVSWGTRGSIEYKGPDWMQAYYDSGKRAGWNSNGDIYLNLGLVKDPKTVERVLAHEFVHSWFRSYENEGDRYLNEGITEALTDRIVERIHVSTDQEQRYSYIHGPRQFAELLFAALGEQQVLTHSLIDGDFNGIGKELDKRFGGGSFSRIMSRFVSNVDSLESMGPFVGFLEIAGRDAFPIAAEANKELPTGRIYFYQGEGLHGAFLLAEGGENTLKDGMFVLDDGTGEITITPTALSVMPTSSMQPYFLKAFSRPEFIHDDVPNTQVEAVMKDWTLRITKDISANLHTER